jgi:ER lumen protein retaining receptor
MYNTVMKIVFLSATGAILYYMKFHKVVKLTYDKEQDTFKYQFLVIPCLGLALLVNSDFTPFEVHVQKIRPLGPLTPRKLTI